MLKVDQDLCYSSHKGYLSGSPNYHNDQNYVSACAHECLCVQYFAFLKGVSDNEEIICYEILSENDNKSNNFIRLTLCNS